MPYAIKQTSTGKWVARPGSRHSFTNDLNEAAQFGTLEEVQSEACLEGESIWYIGTFPIQVFNRGD